jgi:hypothetical protein
MSETFMIQASLIRPLLRVTLETLPPPWQELRVNGVHTTQNYSTVSKTIIYVQKG